MTSDSATVREIIEAIRVPFPMSGRDDKETVQFFSHLNRLVRKMHELDSMEEMVRVCVEMNEAELLQRMYVWRMDLYESDNEVFRLAADAILDSLETASRLPTMLGMHVMKHDESRFENVRKMIQTLYVPGRSRDDYWDREEAGEKMESLIEVMDNVPSWDRQRVRDMMQELNLASKLEDLKAQANYEKDMVAEVQAVCDAYERLNK